jgi:hypothetical protein
MDDAADHTAIVDTLHAAHIRRQMGLNPQPLLVAQPEQTLTHDTNPRWSESDRYRTLKCEVIGF